nr:MAG TPA: hypothetical protein [Bacteriophage sp.]
MKSNLDTVYIFRRHLYRTYKLLSIFYLLSSDVQVQTSSHSLL